MGSLPSMLPLPASAQEIHDKLRVRRIIEMRKSGHDISSDDHAFPAAAAGRLDSPAGSSIVCGIKIVKLMGSDPVTGRKIARPRRCGRVSAFRGL